MSKKLSHLDKHWNSLAKEYDPIKIGSIDGTDVIPHDKGIYRATVSEYVANKKIVGKPHRVLFIGRLSPRTTQATIVDKFSKFGVIILCRLVKDIVTGESKCYAFVEYDNSESVYTAYKSMNLENIDGNQIIVDYEMERTLPGWKPRRLGGGFGGKKESGQLRFGCRSRPFKKPIIIENKKNSRDRYCL